MNDSLEKIVIKCPECGQKLRIPLFKTKKLQVDCQKCETTFPFNCKKYRIKQVFKKSVLLCLFLILLFSIPAMPFVLKNIFVGKLESKRELYSEKLNQLKENFLVEVKTLESEKNIELKKIDSDAVRSKLKEKASEDYLKIWKERSDYNSRYAITEREKAQLEMKALSADRTKTIDQIVRDIAAKASPKNSTISIIHSTDGIGLEIDFDMAELTSGEEGTSTKHNTLESLKKEAVKLISKVTNDVYAFCKDLELFTVTVGCRHYVNMYYGDKSYYFKGRQDGHKTNTLIYKMKLDKEDIEKLEANPFLKIYSTTGYLEVEHDEFPNLELSNEK